MYKLKWEQVGLFQVPGGGSRKFTRIFPPKFGSITMEEENYTGTTPFLITRKGNCPTGEGAIFGAKRVEKRGAQQKGGEGGTHNGGGTYFWGILVGGDHKIGGDELGT